MTYVLNPRERKLLDRLQIAHTEFHIRGQLGGNIGDVTLSKLLSLGLLETGSGRFGDIGYRLSDDGWRCMYGKTHDEMMADGEKHYPLKVWSWPPSS